VIFVVVINFLFGFSGLVDNYAHLGGLLSGAFIGTAIVKKVSEQWSDRDKMYRKIAIGLAAAFYIVTILVLFIPH
jgi:membrane associated rhomboid family serine protease